MLEWYIIIFIFIKYNFCMVWSSGSCLCKSPWPLVFFCLDVFYGNTAINVSDTIVGTRSTCMED